MGAQKCTVLGPMGLFHSFPKPPAGCCPVIAGASPTPATVLRAAGRTTDWRRKGDGRKAARRMVQVLRGAAIVFQVVKLFLVEGGKRGSCCSFLK